MISTKTCSKCKIEQPISNFSKNKCMKDGFCNWCKECYKERGREYYKKNKEKINASELTFQGVYLYDKGENDELFHVIVVATTDLQIYFNMFYKKSKEIFKNIFRG